MGLFSNNGTSFRSTTLSVSSACIKFSTSPYLNTLSSEYNKQLKENSDKYIKEAETLTMLNNSHYTAQSYLTIGELFERYYLN